MIVVARLSSPPQIKRERAEMCEAVGFVERRQEVEKCVSVTIGRVRDIILSGWVFGGVENQLAAM